MWLRLAARGDVGYIRIAQAVRRRHESNMCIAYYAGGGLGDLKQRKSAIDFFFEVDNGDLPRHLHERALFQLGCDAIDSASAAWEEGRLQQSSEFVDFAIGACRRSKHSLHWIKFSTKKLLGIVAYNILRKLIPFMRGSALRR